MATCGHMSASNQSLRFILSLRLYSSFITSRPGVCPKSFGETILCPLHKRGPTSDPNDFRGISLVNTMYKIFSSILNKRLYALVEENEKLDESQAGLRAGYSAIDNIFSLSAVTYQGAADSSIVYMLTFKKHSIRWNTNSSLKV